MTNINHIIANIETESTIAVIGAHLCTFVPLSLCTREAVWPGMGTDFLALLERDVDTNGFEPAPPNTWRKYNVGQ